MPDPTASERVREAVQRDCPHSPEDNYEWTYHRSCHTCWIQVVVAAEQAAERRVREECIKVIEEFGSYYPETVWTPCDLREETEPGSRERNVGERSAAAMARHVCRVLAKDVRALGEEEK